MRLTLGNSNYYACALEALLARFPTVPKAHVRVALNMHRNQFAPTFLHFCETIGRTWEKKDPHPEENGDGSDESTSAIPQQKALPFKPLQNPRRPLPDDDKFGVRQLRARWSSDVSLDAIFLLEVDCLEERERVVAEEFDQKLAAKVNADEYEACGDLIECGCCYGDFAFELMVGKMREFELRAICDIAPCATRRFMFTLQVQCEEGHLFCRECARRAAEEQLGLRKCTLLCLSGDGCDASFPPTVIEQFLPEKTLELYHTIKQELDISSAIEDDSSYETCPFCPYGVFMESSVCGEIVGYCECHPLLSYDRSGNQYL